MLYFCFRMQCPERAFDKYWHLRSKACLRIRLNLIILNIMRINLIILLLKMRCQNLLITKLVLSALTGCNQSYSQVQQPSPAPQRRVVTTFLPMYWFTKAIVGEEVEILIPPGTEHDYQATPANISAIATANVLKNGIETRRRLDDITSFSRY